MQMVIHAVLLRQQSTAVACLFLNNLVGRRSSSSVVVGCEAAAYIALYAPKTSAQ